MKYTLIFLFNQTATKVLLMFKTRGPYLNVWNGIGGKIEKGETPRQSAIREAKEEVGIELSSSIRTLVTCLYPSGCELNVFYAMVTENEPKQMEDEKIEWFWAEAIIQDYNFPTAGEGNVRYFVEAALTEIAQEGKV